jgi:hypothetical protein
VSSASAEETFPSEWLVEESSVTSTLPITTEIEFLVEDENGGKSAAICREIIVGTIKPKGEGSITKILNEKEEEISELGGLAILCKRVSVCENSATDVELSPMKLPWTTSIVSMLPEGRLFFLELITGAIYVLSCLALGVKVEDECKQAENTSIEVQDGPISADIPAGTEISPQAECSIGGKEAGIMKIDTISRILSPEGIVTAEVL